MDGDEGFRCSVAQVDPLWLKVISLKCSAHVTEGGRRKRTEPIIRPPGTEGGIGRVKAVLAGDFHFQQHCSIKFPFLVMSITTLLFAPTLHHAASTPCADVHVILRKYLYTYYEEVLPTVSPYLRSYFTGHARSSSPEIRPIPLDPHTLSVSSAT